MKPGIYIHIPFCKSRCSYCDFATDVLRSEETVARYVNALINEISNFSFQSSNQSRIQDLKSKIDIDTIYFGGGTPSLLSASAVEKILQAIYSKFDVDENAEITLEMNPATVSLEKLNHFRSLGVNRASFGVQTFDDRSLKLLARGHDSNDARKTFELLRQSGFENISFDLIAGLPHQTLADWKLNLSEAMSLAPEHISLYILEIHEATPLAEQIRSRRQPQPDEDLAAEMYEVMFEKLAFNGFEQYEISNFAKPGFRSRHNSKYWLCEPVFGFGVSAHSFDGVDRRYSNERETGKYINRVESGNSTVVEDVSLTKKQVSGDFAFLMLRRSEGLDLPDYKKRFGIDLKTEFREELARLNSLGLIVLSETNLKLTDKGKVYSNEVFSVFV
ncbi:MAG: radical SAM family heme chaperone HemW [Pyrinomonadaceae bacterium]|nr:radical SAM family heme chaperone HemW [Pyrinomonadaceae bacterium]